MLIFSRILTRECRFLHRKLRGMSNRGRTMETLMHRKAWCIWGTVGRSAWLVGFPGGSADKESACNVRDRGLIPGLGRSPGEGNGNALQYPGLENSTDCTVHGVAKSQDTTKWLSLHFTSEWLVGCKEEKARQLVW